jgi:flagellar basal body rod protein FlgC
MRHAMQIGSAMQSATLGLALNRTRLDGHAHQIANLNSEGYENVDLATEIVGTLVSSHAYTANATVLRTAAETQKSLFDALA